MSDSKHAPEKWRSEELRIQRKARIANMKSRNGGKKPISNKRPVALILLSIILVFALIGTGVWVAFRTGMVQRSVAAMNIGSEKISIARLNYYYRLLLSNYGIDPSTEDGKSYLTTPYGVDGFATIDDYLKDAACKQVQQEYTLYANALKSGLSLSDADRKAADDFIVSLKTSAQKEDIDLDNFMITEYGTGMNLQVMRAIYEDYLLSSKLSTQKLDSFTFTDQQINDYYALNKDTYDVVSYRVFTINSTAADTDTTDDKAKALEAAHTKANEMLGMISGADSFRVLCIAYASDADLAYYQAGDKSLMADMNKEAISTEHTTWLFDAARKPGDKTIIDAANGYSVLYFAERKLPDTENISVRHMLVKAAKSTTSDDEKATARTKAELLLNMFLSGDMTEESFGSLAKINSEDNAAAGGLYSGVAPGQMVAEFNDWCFDKNRKPGDTGIVQTEFGFHVMYFVKKEGAAWKAKIKTTLTDDAYATYIEEAVKEYPYTTNSFGMRFIA